MYAFLDTLYDDIVKKIDGRIEIVPVNKKIDLGVFFFSCLNTKIHPSEFELKINKGSGIIKNSDGEFYTWKHSLNKKLILHCIVLYHLCYVKGYYHNKYHEIKDIPKSINLKEFFDKSKKELYDTYNKIKDCVAN